MRHVPQPASAPASGSPPSGPRASAPSAPRLLLALAAVTAVVAAVATLVTVKLTAAPAHLVASESVAPAAVVRQVTAVPAGVLAQASPGQVATSLQQAPASAPPLRLDGKPAIVFVSEESCPFCAAERWPLTVALSHFGTWSQLGVTKSAATDIYPDTALRQQRGPVRRGPVPRHPRSVLPAS